MGAIQRVTEYIDFKGVSKYKFYKETGLSNGFLDKGENLGSDKCEKIISHYPDLNAAWLLTGKGDMLVKKKQDVSYSKFEDNNPKYTVGKEGLPVIPIEAIAGFGKGDIQILESEISERYLVPLFQKRGAKYLISVGGNSMWPKYNSGDLLACKPLEALSFVQWGKSYVLDTEQGAIVKRLFEHPEDKDLLICKSDNAEFYPPFNIHKKSIWNVAMVVGVIRLE
jgi:repressor LexA